MLTNGGRFMDGTEHYTVDIPSTSRTKLYISKSMGNGDCEQNFFKGPNQLYFVQTSKSS